ncbi:hypothetical protein QL285_088452 [Trifolium repens]|nr:hypothetical protein QL285_088452 [Trifolium repens]
MGIEEQGNELTISSFLSILSVVLGDEAQELGESGVCNEAILSPTTCVYHSNSKIEFSLLNGASPVEPATGARICKVRSLERQQWRTVSDRYPKLVPYRFQKVVMFC